MPPQGSGKNDAGNVSIPRYLRAAARGVIVSVTVQPRASKDELAGEHGGMLKIRLTAPPVDGEANAALTAFISKVLKLPKSNIEISSGKTSRKKTVLLCGISIQDAAARLNEKA